MPALLDLCSALPQRSFAPGDLLVQEGKDSRGEIFFLIQGALEVLKEGGIAVAVLAEPGSVVGEMSLLLERPHSASVRALEPTRCYVAHDGTAFLQDHPAVALAVARILSRRLFMSTSYLADLKRQFADQDPSLAMLDEVLATFVHHHGEDECEPGSEREREPNY